MKQEKVTFIPNPLNNGECIPQLEVDGESFEFTGEHMSRVLDFDNMPEPPPPDAPHRHFEFEIDENEAMNPQFPKRYFCLRGSFIFYFDMEDVDGYIYDNLGVKFNGPPKGVIPLERTVVEFPPGGRRVFREHANTDARNGYELMIRHVGRGGLSSSDSSTAIATKRRAPAYIVMDSLGQRDTWAKAIKTRADIHKRDTLLRGIGVPSTSMTTSHKDEVRMLAQARKAFDSFDLDGNGTISTNDLRDVMHSLGKYPTENELRAIMKKADADNSGGISFDKFLAIMKSQEDILTKKSGKRDGRNIGGDISVLAGIIEQKEQHEIDEAIEEFGSKTFFDESEWINNFFRNHDEAEAAMMASKLERWQTSIKKGLRGAVLEQYEYFVEASREMSIMGKEVLALKDLSNKQVELLETLNNIDVTADIVSRDDEVIDAEDELEAYSSDSDTKGKSSHNSPSRSKGLIQSSGSFHISPKKNISNTTEMEIPDWLIESVEDTDTFLKRACYSDAADLLLKAKSEILELMSLSEKLTEKKLTTKQLSMLQRIEKELNEVGRSLCDLLLEGLRRKNEALRLISKKERADPLNAMAPIVSPIALNDDSTSLGLLIKLGRGQDAASAYSMRRSLLLNECLNERPIVNTNLTNNLDIVIYAAQLSHSYFSCMSQAVEGFLDLFAENKTNVTDDMSFDSSIKTSGINSIPSNALATICLWCDSELSKYASAFGLKVLGNLALSPKEATSNAITSKIMKFEASEDMKHLREQLRSAEEMGEYAAAGKLRKKIAIKEQEEKEKPVHQMVLGKNVGGKERKIAIEIAAKCIEQALDFSTEFLNSIGLPLAPRLAEYLRTRLKGCEAEVAMELEERWNHILFDWKIPTTFKNFDLPSPGMNIDNRKNIFFSGENSEV